MERPGRLLRLGLVLCLAVVAVYLAIGAFEPFRSNWGDPWSDGNAMTSGRYFAQDGFIATRFTPILDVGALGPTSLRYTHYPPLPDIVNGLVQCAIGGGHLAAHRLFALLLTGLAVLLFFVYVRELWGRAIAQLAVVAIATNVLFIEYADSIHHIPIYWFTGWAALVACVRWLDTGRRRWLVAVGVATYLCVLASYDFDLFLAVMVPATILLRKHRLLRGRGLALVAVFGGAAIASVATKNLLVIWAVGYDAWHRDLVFQFFERASEQKEAPYKEGMPILAFWRLWRVFSPIFFAGILAQLVGILDRVRGRTSELSLQPLVLLCAGLPFLFVFTQLVTEQAHPMLLLAPFAAVNLAMLIEASWRRLRAAGAVLLVLYLGWQGWQLAHMHKEFLRTRDAEAVAKVLPVDHHRFVLTNFMVDGPVRYLWDRHLMGIPISDAEPKAARTSLAMRLRDQFDQFGSDSPLTIVEFLHFRTHMFERGLYAYFQKDRRWQWIARPSMYAPTWQRHIDLLEKNWSATLKGVGSVVYESPDVRVIQVAPADLDRVQLAALPLETPNLIDFATSASNAFKWYGISEPAVQEEVPRGFAVLRDRQPSYLRFTMQGFKYDPIAPPNRTAELRMRLPVKPIQLELDVSTSVENQALSIAINGHELVHAAPVPAGDMHTISAEVPADALSVDGLQAITLTHTQGSNREKVFPLRLHALRWR
jgi:hypothetical protein